VAQDSDAAPQDPGGHHPHNLEHKVLNTILIIPDFKLIVGGEEETPLLLISFEKCRRQWLGGRLTETVSLLFLHQPV